MEGRPGDPGAYIEAAAGDYYQLACRRARDLTPEYGMVSVPGLRDPHAPCLQGVGRKIRTLIIPEGWWVALYSKADFEGEVTELDEGEHRLDEMGLAGEVYSMQIRGPWTVMDGMVYDALARRRRGWFTADSSGSLRPRDIVRLIRRDPARPTPSEFFDEEPESWGSSFRPGWQERLSSRAIRSAEKLLGIRRR